MKICKLFIVLILIVVLCSFGVSSVTAAANDTITEVETSKFSNSDSFVEVVSFLVSQIVVILTVIITSIVNNRSVQKGIDEQRYLLNIQEINKIMIDVYDAYLEAVKAVILHDGDKAVFICDKIDKTSILVMNYCSNDAEKLTCYYHVKMNEMKMASALNKEIDLTFLSSMWLPAYLSVLHSVLKYEVTGNRTSPQNALSLMLNGLSEDLYAESLYKANEIIKNAKISKEYLCKNV